MTSPLTYAPKTNHELSTLQWGWSSNKLSALSKAIGNVAGTPPSPLARPAYHPTLWTRAQETWDLISRTEVMEQATSDPVLNEWLALLWGLCTKQIHSAYLAESQEVDRKSVV